MIKGISVADLEKALGKKADSVSDQYNPQTGGITRSVTFSLGSKPAKTKRGK
jgi:hypothetical protein